MTNTYTYTARHAKQPDKVITFTLQDDYLKVNLTGLLENLRNITSAEDHNIAAKENLKQQIKPATLKMLENLSGPIHVSDVKVRLNGSEGEKLNITAWKRLGGLRLAPVTLAIGKVDNQEAAEAFVDEVENRKELNPQIGRFFGPLDYWFGWLGLGLLITLLLRWPMRRG
ncbi:MAG: hypothetical protein PVG14_19260 [Anaerolineales bacterium]|jgi:hypothetical protein